MTSPLAIKLADDLIRFGELLGFQASKEEPIHEGSLYKIDVFWKLAMPDGSLIPSFNIASIEIQYSYSPSSISHNILKSEGNMHPSMHIVLSYSRLNDDFIDNVLRRNYPSGLLIRHGEEEINKFHLWINKHLLLEDVNKGIIRKSEIFRKEIVEELFDVDENEYENKVLPKIVDYITPILIPKEITSFVDSLLFLPEEEYNRSVFDDVFDQFVLFIQQRMAKHSIKYISIPTDYLLTDYMLPNEYVINYISLDRDIIIDEEGVWIRDSNGYLLSLFIEDGNIMVYNGGLICTESLSYSDFRRFILLSCKYILPEFEKYRIKMEDIDLLKSIVKEFEK